MKTSSWPSLSKSPAALPQGQNVSRPARSETSANFLPPRFLYRALPKNTSSGWVPRERRERMRPMLVVESHPHIGVHIGEEEVQPAVVVEVEDPGPDRPERGAAQGLRRDVGEGAIAVVAIQLRTPEHAGNQHVEMAVPIEVEDRDVAAPALSLQSCLRRHVLEGAVALVAVQDVLLLGGPRHVLEGGAPVVASLGIEVVGGPLGRVGHQEVEQAVVVEVEEDGGLRVADVANPGAGGQVGEGAVAVVVEEHVAAARAGDEEVLVAVVVVVGKGGGHAHAVPEGHAGLVGHVLEGAIPLVAKERAGAQLIAEEDVVVAVAVVVPDGHAAAVVVQVDLEGLSLLAGQEGHAEVESRFPGPLEKDRPLRRGCRVSSMPSPFRPEEGRRAHGADNQERGQLGLARKPSPRHRFAPDPSPATILFSGPINTSYDTSYDPPMRKG
jgi:hypothetical protein